MIVDLFTHVRAPERGFIECDQVDPTGWLDETSNIKFLELINQRVKISELALLISETPETPELPIITTERIFKSFKGTGFIDANYSDLFKFLFQNKLFSDTEFRVHGAFFGACAADTALQFYSMIYKGEFLHPTINNFRTKVERIWESGLLEMTKISYGVVYKPFQPLDPMLEEFNKQLVRPHTEIFSYIGKIANPKTSEIERTGEI